MLPRWQFTSHWEQFVKYSFKVFISSLPHNPEHVHTFISIYLRDKPRWMVKRKHIAKYIKRNSTFVQTAPRLTPMFPAFLGENQVSLHQRFRSISRQVRGGPIVFPTVDHKGFHLHNPKVGRCKQLLVSLTLDQYKAKSFESSIPSNSLGLMMISGTRLIAARR